MSLDLKSFKFKLSQRTQTDLWTSTRASAVLAWGSGTRDSSSLSNPLPQAYSVLLLVLILYPDWTQALLSVAHCSSLVPQCPHFAHISSWSGFPLLHISNKPNYFPRSSLRAHFSRSPSTSFELSRFKGLDLPI